LIAHFEWGLAGAKALNDKVAVTIIVDVLSFSTCVDVATSRGASVFPFALRSVVEAVSAAETLEAEVAGPRGNKDFVYSLSPATMISITNNTKLLLPSPNGSAISAAVQGGHVLAGCLRNAGAVAKMAVSLSRGADIAVIAAGEHWPDGTLRFAIEDLIGCGAILDRFGVECSAEAQVALTAYQQSRPSMNELIKESVSGKELNERGYPQDVELALQIDCSNTAPMLNNGCFVAV
jgi:2-phosphosulfolactate phosphatase